MYKLWDILNSMLNFIYWVLLFKHSTHIKTELNWVCEQPSQAGSPFGTSTYLATVLAASRRRWALGRENNKEKEKKKSRETSYFFLTTELFQNKTSERQRSIHPYFNFHFLGFKIYSKYKIQPSLLCEYSSSLLCTCPSGWMPQEPFQKGNTCCFTLKYLTEGQAASFFLFTISALENDIPTKSF